MAKNPPYLASPGTLTTALKKIKAAKTPERFNKDYLNAVLKMKGGSARALIPFFKRINFLHSDGTPTHLYERFRNDATEGEAAAEALRHGYSSLFDVNEYAHELSDAELKGLIVQVTGAEKGSSTVKKCLATFKKLKEWAGDEAPANVPEPNSPSHTAEPVPVASPNGAPAPPGYTLPPQMSRTGSGIGLSYTINIQLPATTNIEVFHAIFRSLKEHLIES